MDHEPTLEFSFAFHSPERYSIEARFSSPVPHDERAVSAQPVHFDLNLLREALDDPLHYGRLLTQQLFADPALLRTWTQARTVAAQHGAFSVRLRFGADCAPLHLLRWETLQDPLTNTRLALSEGCHLARTLDGGDYRPLPREPHPAELRALVAVSAPADQAAYGLPQIDIEDEAVAARFALGDIPTVMLGGASAGAGRVSITALQRELHSMPQIVVLIAHGALAADGQPALYLENDRGLTAPTPGADFVQAISQLARPPLLMILVSCWSAGDDYSALAAVGPQLAQAGVSAVLAFNGAVGASAVRRLLPILFRELRQDGRIDRALSVARAAVTPDSLWWQAVLFLRGSGRLWAGTLSQASQPEGPRVFHAQSLPKHYVPRPEIHRRLKGALLTERGGLAVLVISAIHGLGGIGKTTEALALAHDPDVQRHFPDGIFWATLGQHPDLLSLLGGWVQSLGDYHYHAINVHATSAHLRSLLYRRAALLVVDDAWNTADVRPFLVGGPRCQVLITTRRANVAEDVDASLHELDVMDPEQALTLLAARLGRPIVGEERGAAEELAALVGHLPLALDLVAARIASGVPWHGLRDALTREVARLELLDGARQRRQGHARLEATFALSLDALRTEDPDALKAFAWLGVLQEDAAISAPMAASLWEIDVQEADALLTMLADDALLLEGSTIDIGAKVWTSYRMHDLLHDVARRVLVAAAPLGLGVGLDEAHRALLRRYTARTRQKKWSNLPFDGYIHHHLAWHMEQAGEVDGIFGLLLEADDNGQNGWYRARERLDQLAGYVDDVLRAWRLTDAALHSSPPTTVTRKILCALLIATLNSLADNIPPALLDALVERGVWQPARALTFARRMPEPQRRASAIAAVARTVPEPQRGRLFDEALAVVRSLHGERARAEALASLAALLPEERRTAIYAEAVAGTHGLHSAHARAEALVALALLLPEQMRAPVRREALDAAGSIVDLRDGAALLVSLGAYVPTEVRNTIYATAIAAIFAISPIEARRYAARELLRRLPESLHTQFKEALARVESIERKPASDRIRLLVRVDLNGYGLEITTDFSQRRQDEPVDYLDEKPQVSDLIAIVMRSFEHIFGPEEVVDPANVAAEVLGDTNRQESGATADLRQATGKHQRQATTGQLTPRPKDKIMKVRVEATEERFRALLPEILRSGLSPAAFAAIRSINTPDLRQRLLQPLVVHLAGGGRTDEALRVIEELPNGLERSKALAAVVPHLSEERFAALLERRGDAIWAQAGKLVDEAITLRLVLERRFAEAVAVTNPEEEPVRYERLLQHIGRRLAEIETHPVIVSAQEMAQHVQQWAKALRWSHQVLVGNLDAGIAYLHELNDEEVLIRVLFIIPRYLPEHYCGEALRLVWTVRDRARRGFALAALAPYLPVPLLREAVQVAQSIEDQATQERALTALAGLMGEHGFDREALALARFIPDEGARAELLADLTGWLGDAALLEGMDLALALDDPDLRDDALCALAPHLVRAGYVDRLLPAERAGRREQPSTSLLKAMLINLPGERLAQMRALVVDANPSWRRDDLLITLAERTAMLGHLDEALAIDLLVERPQTRAGALAELARLVPRELRRPLLLKSLVTAGAIERPYVRDTCLANLVPYLARHGLNSEALRVARALATLDARVEALLAILPTLSGALRTSVAAEAWMAVRPISAPDVRLRILTRLAASLGGLDGVPYVDEALALAHELLAGGEQARHEGLLAELAEALMDAGYHSAGLLIASHMSVPAIRPQLLGRLALCLANGGKTETALDLARAIDDVLTRTATMAALAPHLGLSELAGLIEEVGRLADSERRAAALADMAPGLPWKLLLEAARMAAAIDDLALRHVALAPIAPRLVRLAPDRAALVGVWDELLHALTQRTRSDLLSDLTALLPLIIGVGSREVLPLLARVLQQTLRWWP